MTRGDMDFLHLFPSEMDALEAMAIPEQRDLTGATDKETARNWEMSKRARAANNEFRKAAHRGGLKGSRVAQARGGKTNGK